MADSKLEIDNVLEAENNSVGVEMRTLAENMLAELEHGEVANAVALVSNLNQVRDKTLYNEIGRLTRALHESIKNLNIDNLGAASEIDHATDKLTYVLEMTDKSANRTMDLVDASLPLVADIQQGSQDLSARWQRFLNKELQPAEFRQLSKDINAYLQNSSQQSQQLQGQLSDIMLAQDFQDLTGQVIHKVTALVRDVESRLVNLVVMAGHVDSITGITHSDLDSGAGESEPRDAAATDEGDIVAEGPQINTASEDVVNSQDDVDDLLSSLGF